MLSSNSSVSQKKIGTGMIPQGPNEQIQSNFGKNSRDIFPFSSTRCPSSHMTHDFLACDAFTACWYDASYGDGHPCISVNVTGFKALFPCQSGASFVPYSLVCNHLQDCEDNSDENFCVFPTCSAAWQYQCANGQCLQADQYCDSVVQCVDDSDEIDCNSIELMKYVRPRPPFVADFDGRGSTVYEPLIVRVENSAVVCHDTHILCPGDGYCLPVYVRCNGHYDCPGLEDELDCDSYTCPGLYRCRGLLNFCLHPDHLCDGWSQCPQHDDELFCNLTCPDACTCRGHAFMCTGDFVVEQFSRLRYLDAGGIKLKPRRLVKNQMLVYLNLSNCHLEHLDNLTLPNLLSLDLSDNRVSFVTVGDLNLMKNLQNLSLARNPLLTLFSGNVSSGFLEHKDILHVDLSGVQLRILHTTNDLPFPSLRSLNLSESGVARLIGDDVSSLTSLRILDLRGCPMTVFPRHIFKNLKNLHHVFSDNFKLCCEATLPKGFNLDNCQAPFDEISSCDALLRADVYRVCLSVLAALALSESFRSQAAVRLVSTCS